MLFILCSEFLFRLFNKEEGQGKLHGIKIDKGAPAIHHLMYVDDLLVMCRANEAEAESMRNCMDNIVDGQAKRSMRRNPIFFSKNTKRLTKSIIKQELGLKRWAYKVST